jgi:hypothetical protein
MNNAVYGQMKYEKFYKIERKEIILKEGPNSKIENVA